MRLDLGIPGARSRKDRRQVVKSLKERLHSRFQVACAEVGDLDTWTRASLGVTACANEKEHLEDVVQEVERYARNDPGALLGNVEREIFKFGEMA